MSSQPKMQIDLRSDTVTLPTAAMLSVMFQAPVGDDVYGEDPSVNLLETEVAGLLGKEAALFVPTGTMANQLAIQVHTRPGDSVLTEEHSHCFIYEAGAAAALSGVQVDLIPLAAQWASDVVHEAIRGDNLHSAPTRLIVMENTHNRGGGRVTNPATLSRIGDIVRGQGIAMHCDGARLWNAAVALGVPEVELAKPFDTLAVCFSKGLGAPVGSALCGPRVLIDRARKLRKRWGGGMRQAGYLAAAARFALHEHRARLAEDHAHAKLLARGVHHLARSGQGIACEPASVETNLVYFDVPGSAAAFVAAAAGRGLGLGAVGARRVRAVTHLGVSRADIDMSLAIMDDLAR